MGEFEEKYTHDWTTMRGDRHISLVMMKLKLRSCRSLLKYTNPTINRVQKPATSIVMDRLVIADTCPKSSRTGAFSEIAK